MRWKLAVFISTLSVLSAAKSFLEITKSSKSHTPKTAHCCCVKKAVPPLPMARDFCRATACGRTNKTNGGVDTELWHQDHTAKEGEMHPSNNKNQMQQASETLRWNKVVRKSISYKLVHSCSRRQTFQVDLKTITQNTFEPSIVSFWAYGYETPQVSQSLLQLQAVHEALFQVVKHSTCKITSNTDCSSEGSRTPDWLGSTAIHPLTLWRALSSTGSSLCREFLLFVLTTDTEI